MSMATHMCCSGIARGLGKFTQAGILHRDSNERNFQCCTLLFVTKPDDLPAHGYGAMTNVVEEITKRIMEALNKCCDTSQERKKSNENSKTEENTTANNTGHCKQNTKRGSGKKKAAPVRLASPTPTRIRLTSLTTN
ncbi:hypothetical protein EYZ11_008187 [Aspergillus tanneri]|uniref:Uncharacterized protein n=1 Tax=Aspergillus tanneri TaxID=1220188 RepID=A0A4S3JB29_9EURO|nr:hypothetical protein EYZ11_008187 [Aspergillus tanneri]